MLVLDEVAQVARGDVIGDTVNSAAICLVVESPAPGYGLDGAVVMTGGGQLAKAHLDLGRRWPGDIGRSVGVDGGPLLQETGQHRDASTYTAA